MSAYPEVGEALAGWLAGTLGVGRVEVGDLERHAGGFSWQTYTLTASWVDPETGEGRSAGYAVRRQPEDGLLAPYDIEAQYRLQEAVHRYGGIPVPAVRWLEPDPGPLGMPFYVMDRVDGVVPVQWRGNDPEVFPDDSTRRAIGHDFVDVLAAIHAIDVDAAGLGFLGDGRDPVALTLAEIDHWEAFYERSFLTEVPLLRFLAGWLRRNLATSGRVGLVHGDYRIGNFILGPDRRVAAVLDWELAHVGDVAFDVAWAGMPLFRGRSPLWSHLLPGDEFVARYEEASGVAVDADVLRFWTMFGHLRAAAPHLGACRAFEEGRTGDLRLAAMGHQTLYILRQLADQLGWRDTAA